MSQLEEIRKRLEAEEAFENSAEIGLNLLAALEAVEAQHPREVLDVHEGYGAETWCPSCRVHWPCPTAKATTEALA